MRPLLRVACFHLAHRDPDEPASENASDLANGDTMRLRGGK
jgi:hypothetical protein